MAQILSLSREDPVVHLKAYGGIKIQGVEAKEIVCDINAPDLVTMVEEDGHVYITVNSSCSMTVPVNASFEIEKGMGSIKISGVQNKIMIAKVLGNLVLKDVAEVAVEKIGGNFSLLQAAGSVIVEKVGGNLVLSGLDSFRGEKIGGSCKVKDIRGDFILEKMGGGFKGQNINGTLRLERLGGSFSARQVSLAGDLHAGGDVRLKDFNLASSHVEVKAGGGIYLDIGEGFPDTRFEMRTGARNIRVKVREDNLKIGDTHFEYSMGSPGHTMELAAGGSIALNETTELDEEIVGDLSESFVYEESHLSELIQERIDSATRRAENKVKAAEIRLDQIRERVEKHRGFNINVDFGSGEPPDRPEQPVPPVSRPAGKKGASDEERLMILKMLQEKKITVDEAETLFKALEE